MSTTFLLDTSTILWALATPERLSPAALAAVESETLVLSVVSYWEVMVKARKGLLSVGDPVAWWRRASEHLRAQLLPLRSNHVSALWALPDHHKDPFDRMLIAQAIADRLTIVTSDEAIHQYPLQVRW